MQILHKQKSFNQFLTINSIKNFLGKRSILKVFQKVPETLLKKAHKKAFIHQILARNATTFLTMPAKMSDFVIVEKINITMPQTAS